MNITPGYWIQFTSYEGDGDNYQTRDVYGLKPDDVKFYLLLADNFRSQWNSGKSKNKKSYGNEGIEPAVLIKMIRTLLDSSLQLSLVLKIEWEMILNDPAYPNLSKEEIASDISEQLSDTILGNASENYYDESLFCRVFEEYKIFYIEQEIPDVTNDFSNIIEKM